MRHRLLEATGGFLLPFADQKGKPTHGLAAVAKHKERNMRDKILLPPVFGLGHSAGQVESEMDLDGKLVDSTWGRQTRSPARIAFLHKSGLAKKYGLDFFQRRHACRVDTLWREDLKLLHDHGVNGWRCSFNLPKINPAKGVFDVRELQRVRDMLDFANELGIEVNPTIWWWDEPGWWDDIGSWESPTGDLIKYYGDIVYQIMSRVGNRATNIDTFNEPTVAAMFTRRWFREGWPAQYVPNARGEAPYRNMLYRIAEAHAVAVPIIREANPQAKIGIAHAAVWNQSDVPYLKQKWDEENFEMLKLLQEVGGKDIIDRVDLNIYMRRVQDLGKPERASWDGYVGYDEYPIRSAPCEVTTGKPWGICPEALYHVSKEFWNEFGLEIRISEHGYPTDKDHEDHQLWDAAMTIYWLDKAAREGVKIGGAFLWSMLGNFEWGEGDFADFGFFTRQRTPRPAMEFIRDCIQAGGITLEVWKKWESVLRKFPLPAEFLATFE